MNSSLCSLQTIIKYQSPSVTVCSFIPANTNGLLNCYPNVAVRPFVLIDNTGQRIFITCTNSSGGIVPKYSTDGGATWTSSSMGTTISNCQGVQDVVGNASLSTILIFPSAYSTAQSMLPIVSKDYGVTFTQYTTTQVVGWNGGTSYPCWAGGVSDDGVYITFCAFNDSSVYGLYRCTNGSSTIANDRFTRLKSTESNIYGCTVSSTGQYQVYCSGNSTVGNHVRSTDYGATWTVMDSFNSITQNYPKISDSSLIWSANGGYVSAAGQANCSNYYNGTTWVYNYGQTAWGSQYPNMNTNLDLIDMSSSGKLMVLACSSVYPSGSINNNGWMSINYGATWNAIQSTYFPTYTSGFSFGKVCCSKNGKYLCLLTQSSTYNGIFKIVLPSTN